MDYSAALRTPLVSKLLIAKHYWGKTAISHAIFWVVCFKIDVIIQRSNQPKNQPHNFTAVVITEKWL